MASCDVHATATDANEKDKPENVVGLLDAVNGSEPKPSKIPVLVRLDNNDSFTYVSTRKYSTLRDAIGNRSKLDETFSSTSTLIYTGDDSGVQMDCSTLEDDFCSSGVLLTKTKSSTPSLHRSTQTLLVASESEKELGADEQVTLRLLQRAVAEMEADVALHADMLKEQMSLELEQKCNSHVEQQVQREMNETLEEIKQTEMQVPEELDGVLSKEQAEEEREMLAKLSEQLAIKFTEALALELSEELPKKELSEELPEKELSEDPAKGLLKMLPEELSEELMVKLSGEMPIMELQEEQRLEELPLELMKLEMPEIEQQDFQEEHRNELRKEPLEQLPLDPSDELVMELSAELTEKLSQEFSDELSLDESEDVSEKLSEQKLQLQSMNLEQPIECFSTKTLTPRKHVRVEQLLEAEHDIQMLGKLLSHDESDPLDSLDQTSNDEADLTLIPNNEYDWSHKNENHLESLMKFFCGKGFRKLGYPILLCGMAVGLIYYFRKD